MCVTVIWNHRLRQKSPCQEGPKSPSPQAALNAQVTRCNPEPGRGHPPTPAESTAWPWETTTGWSSACSRTAAPRDWQVPSGQEDSLIAITGLGSNGHEQFPPQEVSQAAKFHKGAGQSQVEGGRKVCELSLNIPGNSRSTGGCGGGQFYSKLRSCIPQMEAETTEVGIRAGYR